jgi:hypothetical protein
MAPSGTVPLLLCGGMPCDPSEAVPVNRRSYGRPGGPSQARKVDPQLGAKYHRLIVEARLHHYSAVCHLATTLLTRIAACWRNDERYVIRDVDGRRITPTEGRAIVKARYPIPPQLRTRTRTTDETSGSAQ